jgi:hypothetical protein
MWASTAALPPPAYPGGVGKALIVVVVVVFSVYSLFDVLAQTRTRSLSKPVWALIALVPLVGPLLWITLGRPPAARPGGGGGQQLPRVTGPDDDPDFLWNLDRRKRHGPTDEDPPPTPPE